MAAYKWFDLNAAEIAELTAPTPGQGGFQTFFKRLQSQFNNATGTIRLTNGDIDDIKRHALDSGQGGFQDRLIRIFGRHLPNLGRDE